MATAQSLEIVGGDSAPHTPSNRQNAGQQTATQTSTSSPAKRAIEKKCDICELRQPFIYFVNSAYYSFAVPTCIICRIETNVLRKFFDRGSNGDLDARREKSQKDIAVQIGKWKVMTTYWIGAIATPKHIEHILRCVNLDQALNISGSSARQSDGLTPQSRLKRKRESFFSNEQNIKFVTDNLSNEDQSERNSVVKNQDEEDHSLRFFYPRKNFHQMITACEQACETMDSLHKEYEDLKTKQNRLNEKRRILQAKLEESLDGAENPALGFRRFEKEAMDVSKDVIEVEDKTDLVNKRMREFVKEWDYLKRRQVDCEEGVSKILKTIERCTEEQESVGASIRRGLGVLLRKF